MRYYAVIDTNVLVSAMLKWDSVPGSVLALTFDGPIIPILNREIVAEYREVLSRPKFHLTRDITLHGKGGKIRTVPIMKQTVDLLKGYLIENRVDPRSNPDMPLFWNAQRHKLTRSGITYIVQKYADIARETTPAMPSKISPHIFRHTKAMHLVQANVNPVYIKDYLGHADISTTEVYARADNEAKRAALEKATEHLDLPKASHWEQDAELIEWLSSLG